VLGKQVGFSSLTYQSIANMQGVFLDSKGTQTFLSVREIEWNMTGESFP